MFNGFYIITEDCVGEKTNPDGWTGAIKKDTPVALVYFDEYGMEFIFEDEHETSHYHFEKEIHNFRLEKPCPIVAAASCHFCGKIVRTIDLSSHYNTDRNCTRIRNMEID